MSTESEPIENADGTKLMQIYLHYASQTEKFIERRDATSRYFLTINSTLVAILGVALNLSGDGQQIWLASLAVAGVLICVLWWWIVRTYSILTGVRLDVIQRMEKNLPASPYTDESNEAESPKTRGYRSISKLESLVPWVFVIIYAVPLIATLIIDLGMLPPSPTGSPASG